MLLHLLTRSCLVLACSLAALAQQPGAAPGAPPVAPVAKKGDELRRAFVDADGGRRMNVSAAADQVGKEGAASRARFIAVLRAITAVAPAPVPETKPAAGVTAVPGAVEKPVEFADEIKQLMADAATGSPEVAKVALAKLLDDKAAGPAALARLSERGTLILHRCVTAFLRTKMATNAVYAGQFSDLSVFHPEGSALLQRWAQEPPRDAPTPDQFRTACLRALRDVLPTDQATDALRTELRAVAEKAKGVNNQALFLAAVCALHQYGDPSIFDQIKEGVDKQAASENEQAKTAATNTLAELHYQLRKYAEAATYYKALVALLDKPGQNPDNLTTVVYNAACSLALAGSSDEAIQYLEKALQVGAKTRQLSKAMIDEDHDMNGLRGDARFTKLIEQYFGSPAGK